MTSLRKVLGRHAALALVLLAPACQVDSSASFDNSHLDGAGSGGGSAAGSKATAGSDGKGASSSTGGTSSMAGNAGSDTEGGEAGSPSGGRTPGGGAGGGGSSGDAGSSQGGSTAGKGGMGGMAGVGGKPVVVPEPVTITLDGLEDTYVSSCQPYENFGEDNFITLDHDECVYESLLRVPLADVPEGAIVSKATLNLQCIDIGGVLTVSYSADAWLENQVRWIDRPEVGEALGTMHCEQVGPMTFDLTAAVKVWLAEEQKNFGVYLRTATTDGTDFSSSDADDPDYRPSLTVTYTLPIK